MYLIYATPKKFIKVLEKDKVIEDLRIPYPALECTRNVIVKGQVWGRRGNMKLVTLTLATGILNNNQDFYEEIRKDFKECGARIVFTPTQSTMTISILSRNLTLMLKVSTNVIVKLESKYALPKDLISLHISVDMPNWKGTNYYSSDPFFVLQATQYEDFHSHYGVFHIDPEEIDDMLLLMIVQTAINIYPRGLIKTGLDEISRKFFIQKVEDLAVEMRTNPSTKLSKIIT